MLVTIIAAKRCHCRMDMPKEVQAAPSLGMAGSCSANNSVTEAAGSYACCLRRTRRCCIWCCGAHPAVLDPSHACRWYVLGTEPTLLRQQALARLGEAHQQCLRRMEAGLILTSSPLPSNAPAALPQQQQQQPGPAAEFAKIKATMHGGLGAAEGASGALAPVALALEGAEDAAAETPAPVAAEERRRAGGPRWSLPDEAERTLHTTGPIYKAMTRGEIARWAAAGKRLFPLPRAMMMRACGTQRQGHGLK